MTRLFCFRDFAGLFSSRHLSSNYLTGSGLRLSSEHCLFVAQSLGKRRLGFYFRTRHRVEFDSKEIASRLKIEPNVLVSLTYKER